MSNFDTIAAITANLQSVLQGLGVKFSKQAYDNESSIPASLLPHGQIFYESEDFEYTHGERPGYAEGLFPLKIVLNHRDPSDTIREQQRWIHRVRDGLTVNALNIGDIASSKLVSRVTTEAVSIENKPSNISVLSYRVRIRYREL